MNENRVQKRLLFVFFYTLTIMSHATKLYPEEYPFYLCGSNGWQKGVATASESVPSVAYPYNIGPWVRASDLKLNHLADSVTDNGTINIYRDNLDGRLCSLLTIDKKIDDGTRDGACAALFYLRNNKAQSSSLETWDAKYTADVSLWNSPVSTNPEIWKVYLGSEWDSSGKPTMITAEGSKYDLVSTIPELPIGITKGVLLDNFVGPIDYSFQKRNSNSAESLCLLMGRDNPITDLIMPPADNDSKIHPSKGLYNDRFDPAYIQDFKNYLALRAQEQGKFKAKNKTKHMSNRDQSLIRYVAYETIDRLNDITEDNVFDSAFFKHFLLNPQNKFNIEMTLKSRMDSFCSSMENGYCQPVNVSLAETSFGSARNVDVTTTNRSLNGPFDLVAGSLYISDKYPTQLEQYYARQAVYNLGGVASLELLNSDSLFDNAKSYHSQYLKGAAEHLVNKLRLTTFLSMTQQTLQKAFLDRVLENVYDPNGSNKNIKSQESVLSIVKQEGMKRVSNVKWFDELANVSDEEALREITIILAQQLNTKHRINQHLERLKLHVAEGVSIIFSQKDAYAERSRQQQLQYR